MSDSAIKRHVAKFEKQLRALAKKASKSPKTGFHHAFHVEISGGRIRTIPGGRYA